MNRVYVVEDYDKRKGRWVPWSPFNRLSSARSYARMYREWYPKKKFRVTKYVSTQP